MGEWKNQRMSESASKRKSEKEIGNGGGPEQVVQLNTGTPPRPGLLSPFLHSLILSFFVRLLAHSLARLLLRMMPYTCETSSRNSLVFFGETSLSKR